MTGDYAALADAPQVRRNPQDQLSAHHRLRVAKQCIGIADRDRVVPRYCPISCSGSITTGLGGSRSSRGGNWAAATRAGSSGDWLYLEGGPAAAAGATGAQLAETCEGRPAVNVHWPGRSTEDLRAVNITHSIMLRQYS